MGYKNVAQAAQDPSLRERIVACCAQEGQTDPQGVANELMWRCAAQPGWGDAWQYAVNTGSTDPGGDEAVITDGMILSAVQSMLAGEPQEETP